MNSKSPGTAKPDRREFLRLASLSALASALGSSAEANPATAPPNPWGPSHPNVVIIMADQHQAGLTKRAGFPLDTMPTLDRLAETGVSFDRGYRPKSSPGGKGLAVPVENPINSRPLISHR